MQLTHLFKDDSAVSPVIGVILMVAITVILAAVIGTFVLGLGDQVGDTAPQASFSFDFDNNGGDASEAQVTITHESGDSVDADRLTVTVDGSEVTVATDYAYDGSAFADSVGAGDSTVVEKQPATDSTWAGESIRVVWTSESGSNSATLQKQTAPQ
ncbi:type IV pilin [Haloferax prahovense]|uniref:type IV pilin n=1 Tax=Haloferax prahovense TaxID=381852 RepID=UPI0006794594|nr:type IV pilin N-terminal domain-containing protein [Haloferax prahovense]